ncbi:MAG: hypothetical protein H6908_00700 [Hyphomicrobiales bacterium]|nr:hypothetical protein [Hyphomicrobiales bacterium]
MGGMGSGQWYRWDSRDTVEDYCSLRIGYLVRKGYIARGTRQVGRLCWEAGDSTLATIRFESNLQDGALPYFRVMYGNASNGKHDDYMIRLVATVPHYGGERWWFQCPHCRQRVGVLYLGAERFACRTCYGLAYQSTRETPSMRYLRRARTLHKRLGGDGDVDWLPKPKGMHWHTYERLLAEMEAYEDASFAGLAQWVLGRSG